MYMDIIVVATLNKKRLYRIGNQSENIPVVHLGNRQINERGKTVSIKHYNI